MNGVDTELAQLSSSITALDAKITGAVATTAAIEALGIFGSWPLAGSEASWGGYNVRVVLQPGILRPGLGGLVRVVLQFSAGSNSTLDSCWIGQHGGAQPYYFDGNQRQITFNGGSNSAAIWVQTGIQTITSDKIQFTYNPQLPLVVAFHTTGTTNLPILTNTVGCGSWYNSIVGGETASQTAPSGGTWTEYISTAKGVQAGFLSIT